MNERPCDCGDCRSCNAHALSEHDDSSCSRCKGAGCGLCEKDDGGRERLEREELEIEWREANNDSDYGALDDYDDCSCDFRDDV